MTYSEVDSNEQSRFVYPDYCFVQFAKAPLLGQVKTRLSAVLSEAQCLRLHKSLIRAVAQQLTQTGLCPLELWVGSRPSHDFFNKLSTSLSTPLHLQSAGDLGQRMYAASAAVLARAKGVIIVGSDCPFMSTLYLQQTLQYLQSGVDAVVGPAHDGGYVLLALRRTSELLFNGVDWGTENVMQQTRRRLGELGWIYKELPTLSDIDRPDDLQLLDETFID